MRTYKSGLCTPKTCAAQPNVLANVTVEVAGSCLNCLGRLIALPCDCS